MTILNTISSTYLFFLLFSLFITLSLFFIEKTGELLSKRRYKSKNFLLLIILPLLISFYITGYTYLEQSKCPENNMFDGHTRCAGINGVIHIALDGIPWEARDIIVSLKFFSIVLMVISILKIYFILLSTMKLYSKFSKKFLLTSERLKNMSEKINKNLGLSIIFREASVPVRYTGIIGIFKPVVILPEGLTEKLNDRELEALMYHEGAHIIKKDNLVRFIILFCNSFLFFLPMKKTFYKEWDKNRDLECDKFSAFHTGDPLCVASALVKTVELSIIPSEDYGFSCFARSSVRARLEKLIEYSKNRKAFLIENVSYLLLMKNMSFYILFFCVIILLKHFFNIEHCFMELLINI